MKSVIQIQSLEQFLNVGSSGMNSQTRMLQKSFKILKTKTRKMTLHILLKYINLVVDSERTNDKIFVR